MTDMNALEQAYRESVAKLNEAQKRLSGMTKLDPDREQAKRDAEAAMARIAELKTLRAEENRRRNFAGLQSPLAEVISARFDPTTVEELHRAALDLQSEHERAAAERRAKKAAAQAAAPLGKEESR